MRAAVVPSKKSKWEVQEGNPQQHFVHPRADCRIATERARIPLRGLGLCSKDKVKVMEETYQLSEINRAYERVADGKVRFRAVIVN